MSLLRKLFGLGPKVDCKELMANGAILIDVRSPGEFSSGNVKGSQNVPLETIDRKAEKIKKLNKTVVLCCASGMRSGVATAKLKAKGIDAHNGGGWRNMV